MIELPFRLANTLPVVEARVNGTPAEFVVDTGNDQLAAEVFVPPSLAGQLGLRPPAGDGPYPVVPLDGFELGGRAFPGLSAAVFDQLEAIGEKIGAPGAGNLGFAFLRDWRVVFDYRRQVLRLEASRPDGAGHPFETNAGGGFILVPARVNGRGPYRFLVDTGASGCVLSPELAGELGLSGPPVESLAVLGPMAAQMVAVESLEVAGASLPQPEAGVIDILGMTSEQAGVRVDGIVGQPFLSQFVVEIDYPARRLALHPAG